MGLMSFITDDVLKQSDLRTTYQEMHNLSYFYHWGPNEVYRLPCSKRGIFNDYVKHQLKAESKGISSGSGSSKKPYKEGI